MLQRWRKELSLTQVPQRSRPNSLWLVRALLVGAVLGVVVGGVIGKIINLMGAGDDWHFVLMIFGGLEGIGTGLAYCSWLREGGNTLKSLHWTTGAMVFAAVAMVAWRPAGGDVLQLVVWMSTNAGIGVIAVWDIRRRVANKIRRALQNGESHD
jgi:hypothetical protein